MGDKFQPQGSPVQAPPVSLPLPAGASTSANQTNGTQIANASPRIASSTLVATALGTSQALTTTPRTVFGITGDLGTGLAGVDTMPSGVYWLVLVNLAAAPAPGVITPICSKRVIYTNGVPQEFWMGDEEGGLVLTVGATLLLTSAALPTTYTALAGSGMIAQASVSP